MESYSCVPTSAREDTTHVHVQLHSADSAVSAVFVPLVFTRCSLNTLQRHRLPALRLADSARRHLPLRHRRRGGSDAGAAAAADERRATAVGRRDVRASGRRHRSGRERAPLRAPRLCVERDGVVPAAAAERPRLLRGAGAARHRDAHAACRPARGAPSAPLSAGSARLSPLLRTTT